jgi:hypothetical protein
MNPRVGDMGFPMGKMVILLLEVLEGAALEWPAIEKLIQLL